MTDNLLDGFDDIADGIEQQRQQRLRAAAVSTGAQKPDDAARANTIAERRGLPFGVVAENLSDFHEQDRLESLDAVGQRAPVVGQFLADPRRMALAGDEAEGLEKLSGSLAGTREPEDMGFFHRTVRNLLPISDSTYNGTVGATLDYMGARFQAADAKVFSTAAQSLGRVLTFANTANRLTADIYQREAEAAAARGDTARSEALAQAAGRYRDPAGVERFTQGAADFTRDLTAQQQALGAQVQRPASVGAALDAPGNSLRYYGGMLADSVPAMMFAMATRNPEAGAAVMGGTTGMQTYADRVNEGATDLQALKEGAAQGGLEAVGSVIPLSHAFGGGARRFITTPLSEALSEGATQAAQVDAEDLLQGKQTPTSEKLAQVLDAMIVGGPMGLVEAAGGGGPSHAQQRVFGEQMQQAVASTDQAAQLQEITTAAKDSRLVDRSPADAEAFVEAAGAADATVYLPADAVATLFQSAPGALEQAVGGPEALAEQMALGDISIPMAKWVSIVSRLPNVDEIRRHARLSADGLSEVELENFSPEGMAQELGIGNESADAAGAAPEAAAQVQADVYAQLVATQRYTPAQAEAQAKLWGAAFGRIGQMTGQDPLALYKQRMASIGTGTDTAAAPAKTFMQRSIDALRGLLGRPRVAQDARGQQTIERDGSVYAQRAGKWLLTDEQGQPRDFLTLNQAQTAAEAVGGEVVHDDPIEGQRQTWSVALPDTAAREVLSGDIVSLYQGAADPNAPDLDFGDRTDEQLASEYAAMPDTEGGRIIDTDMVRELSPEYRADRSLSPRIHRAASTLTRRLFAQALARPVAEGRDHTVVFTAGGGGSGKSTAIKAVLGGRNADITLDGTLSNLERARSDVAAALASGRNVEIQYVYRSPQNSVEGAIGRAIRTGRPVPVSVLAEAHANAPKVVRALAEEYTGDDRVSITAINNDGPMGTAFEIPVEEIPDVNQRSAERTFRAALDGARDAGRVGPELYAAFGGSSPAAAPAAAEGNRNLDDDAGGAGPGGAAEPGVRGQPQPERTRRRRNPVATTPNPAAGGVSDSGDNRGRIDVFPDQRMAISLFENADLSTFLHESGHFFLEVYRDAAAAESATPQLRADFDALLGWLGVDSPDKIGVDQHEQFARGFEAYLAEGRAPSPELQSVFSQFRAWLLGVYRTLTRLNVQLSDEVRGVFDRMLATETEIEVAQAKVGLQPLARDANEAKQLGLTEKQFADYQRLLAASADEARAEVQQKLEDAHRREREAWWKDESAKVRAEVEAETEALPAVRARRILTGRAEAAGEPVPAHLQGLKLDRAALVADYGARHLKKLGRVFVREGGAHPDEAAALLGFSSGDDLVQNLWVVDQTLAAVPDEVRRRMHERHGNPMTDGTLPELALEAVHNSKRVQVLDRELAVLAQLAGEPRPNRRELRAVAEDVVARKTDRQIKPNGYLAAERRAAADSARAAAAKDYAAALLAKRRQALNAALYAAARRAKDEIASKASDIRKQSEGKARERLGKAGADYLEAMDALTEAFEFRPVSGREVARRQSLRAWVEARQADDDLTAITDALLARVEAERVTNYQDMTLAELRELHEAVTNIAHLARLKNELLKGKDKREWEEAQAELADSIRSALAAGKPLPFSDADKTAMEKLGSAYEWALDWVLRPETVVEWLDGGEAGPWHDYLWNQAEAAQQLRIDYRNKVGGMLAEMSNAMTKEQRADLQRRVYIRGLGRSMSRNTIIAAALNMGNAGNREKLMRGGYLVDGQTHRFTHGDIAEMLGHLTPADGQMIQRIWDAVDSLWPDIEAQQKRLSGVAPERIEPTPLIFSGADGAQISLRGGYYPAVYDPRASRGGAQQARAAEERVMGGTFSRAMTSKGHTKERTEYVAPMLLDYHAVLSRHLNDVITDLSHRGYVKQALRVLEDGELKGLIMERVSEGAYHALYGSVKNSVAGASVAEPGSKMAEKIGDAVLTNTAVAALGFRIPLVLANSVVAPIQAAARVDPKYLASGYIAYYRNPAAATRTIHALSPFMAERADSLDSTYQQVLGKLTGKKGIRAAAMKMAMEVHRWVVPLAERAIWLGRYQQAQAEGAGVADAVLLANKAIRMTQQAGAPKDLSAAERDPRYKWVRMFIGPMVIMNNRLQESGLRGLYLGRVQSPARALGTWLSAAVLSNAVFEILMGRGPDDDDDDGKGAEDWAPWLARKTLLFPFQTFPLLRDVASVVDAKLEGKRVFSRSNPIAEAGTALWNFGEQAWNVGASGIDSALESVGIDWIEDRDVDPEEAVKAGVRAAGPLTGIPSNQMLTTGEYLYDVGTGQYTPDNPAEAAAYLMYRRPKDEK